MQVETTDAVDNLICHRGQILIKPGEHLQGCFVFVRDLQLAQGVGHGPGCLGTNKRIPSISPGITRTQISNALRRQPRQIRHRDLGSLCCGHRNSANCGRLVYNDQEGSVAC